MSMDKVEKLRDEIEQLEEQYNQANFGNMFDPTRQEKLYKKIKKKKRDLAQLEKSLQKRRVIVHSVPSEVFIYCY